MNCVAQTGNDDDAGSQSATAAAAAGVVSVEPDNDGAYTNPAISHSLNPDCVEDVANCRSTDRTRYSCASQWFSG